MDEELLTLRRRAKEGDTTTDGPLLSKRLKLGEEIKDLDFPVLILLAEKRKEFLDLIASANVVQNGKILSFLKDFKNHYHAAMAKVEQQGHIFMEGDVRPPTEEEASDIIFDRLKNNVELRNHMHRMRRPMLELIWTREPDELVKLMALLTDDNLDVRPGKERFLSEFARIERENEMNKNIPPELRKVIRWKVIVVDGPHPTSMDISESGWLS